MKQVKTKQNIWNKGFWDPGHKAMKVSDASKMGNYWGKSHNCPSSLHYETFQVVTWGGTTQGTPQVEKTYLKVLEVHSGEKSRDRVPARRWWHRESPRVPHRVLLECSREYWSWKVCEKPIQGWGKNQRKDSSEEYLSFTWLQQN